MMDFLVLHLGTIAASAVLFIGVVTIIKKMVRDKKKGKCIGCDGGCGNCPNGHKENIGGTK